MSRKKNLNQIVENEQLEYNDPNTDETLEATKQQLESEKTEEEPVDDTVLVNQTYLTEDTLPEELKNQPEIRSEAGGEQEEEETEVEGEEYEGEEETEEGDEVAEEEYEEEGEGDLEEEGEYEYEEEGAGEPASSKIGQVVERVLASVRDADGNLDKAQLAKYAGIAVLGVYGLSRTSLLGKILISGAVSLLASRLLENKEATQQESEVEEEEAVAA